MPENPSREQGNSEDLGSVSRRSLLGALARPRRGRSLAAADGVIAKPVHEYVAVEMSDGVTIAGGSSSRGTQWPGRPTGVPGRGDVRTLRERLRHRDRTGSLAGGSTPLQPGNRREGTFGSAPGTRCTKDSRGFEAGTLAYTTPALDVQRNVAGSVGANVDASTRKSNTTCVAALGVVAPGRSSALVSKG